MVRKFNAEVNADIQEVLNGTSIIDVAKNFSISKSALQRYVRQAKSLPGINEYEFKPNTMVRMIFSTIQEQIIANHLQKSSRMHYGLTTTQARSVVHEYARAINLNIPEKWREEKIAGREWIVEFMKRYSNLSI